MTDRKISELTNITGANVDDANDEIAIVDASANETKAITRAELFSGVSSIDINGGTIDGTVIGGSTAAAISGTTGAFSGDLTVDTNVLFVDASTNRVGIGTSSPSEKLHVTGSAKLDFGSAGGNPRLYFDHNTVTDDANYIQLNRGDAGLEISSEDNLKFNTNASEAMRIDSSGNVGIGKSDPTRELDVAGTIRAGVLSSGNLTLAPGQSGAFISDNGIIVASREDGASLNIRREGTDGIIAYFFNDTSIVGSISVSGASTSYNTSSDYRLKEDLKPVPNPSDRVLALNPVNFAWKADGIRVDGFLAHEVQEVVPEAITGEKDGEEMQAIDQSKLVPLLTAALQDALKRIEALEGDPE